MYSSLQGNIGYFLFFLVRNLHTALIAVDVPCDAAGPIMNVCELCE